MSDLSLGFKELWEALLSEESRPTEDKAFCFRPPAATVLGRPVIATARLTGRKTAKPTAPGKGVTAPCHLCVLGYMVSTQRVSESYFNGVFKNVTNRE